MIRDKMCAVVTLVTALLLTFLRATDGSLCGNSSSCQNRCLETLNIQDMTEAAGGAAAHLRHLRCRCDHLCRLYGDCCEDFTNVCPSKAKDRWKLMKLITAHKYVVCQKIMGDARSRRGLMVVGKCPKNADPFVKLLCESKPNFYNLPSFIPVTGPDGRVYRNRYCSHCHHVRTNEVSRWNVTDVRCSLALKLVFENGVDDIVGTRTDLHSHVISVVKKWMTTHCHPRLEPHPSSNLHFCDSDLEDQKRGDDCRGRYDPVWVREDDGNPLLFRNEECAIKRRGEDITKGCLTEGPEDAARYLLGSFMDDGEEKPYQAYYPGSLTILLNFGPDGKMEVNMVDKDKIGKWNPCPKGSALVTATNTCKKLRCPTGTILLEDGMCKRIDDEDRENVRFETRVTLSLSVRYNTTVIPASWIPEAGDFFKVKLNKYLHIDKGGMLNFSVTARAMGKDENKDGNTEVYAYFDIDMIMILRDESQNDARIVQKMFDDFNHKLAAADRESEAFKVARIKEKITHMPIDNGENNKEEDARVINWCPNGELRFYNGSSEFEYWQEEKPQKNGTVKNETFVKTFNTDTIYETGEFDLVIFVETDLMTDEEVLTQMVSVCQPYPRIKNHDCGSKVILNKTEYRLLKNRSVEVFSDHQIYGINEYEICPRPIKLLVPGKKTSGPQVISAHEEASVSFDKIIVCLCQPEKKREAMFIAFSPSQGMVTAVLLPISMIFLFATVSIYIFFKKLRNLPGLILLHLTLSLLLSQSLLLFSLNYEIDVSWSCTILAVVNHYLLLMSFCWMNTYAYNIYGTFATFTNLSALKNFGVTSKMRKYCAYSYGAPALLVTVCMVIDAITGWMRYGDNDLIYLIRDENGGNNGTFFGNACWINNTMASVTFFGVPVLTMVIANVVFYILTVRHVKSGSKKMITGRRVSTVSVNADSPVDLKTFMRLSSVMGFTWILGYSMVFVKSIRFSAFGAVLQEIFSFLFIISTALQGVGIFVAFATGKRVKEELAEKFSGSRLDWSSRRGSKESVSTISSQTATPVISDRKF